MNVVPENIIVNSCEYTPVYLIPSTSVTQAGSYIFTSNNQDVHKPVTDNLKAYYENSGNLESSLMSSPKPRILKKQSSNVVGNNLKLASFLLPKTDSSNGLSVSSKQIITPVTNVIVKPVVTPVTAAVVNNSNICNTNVVTTLPRVETTTVSSIPRVDTSMVSTIPRVETTMVSTLPRVEIDRKIVRVGTIPTRSRSHYVRPMPKTKPKEKIDPNPSRHTSVQLIKLGETYHSLNQLSDEQMKIVNKALKMFSDPEKTAKEPAYDPVTNTKFIYKVVSPKDLTVVGRNKMVVKKKTEVKKPKVIVPEEPEAPVEPKVTRSGRTVKLPKQMRPGETPQKPKKKVGSVVNCFQCSAEFCSFYRLQRHYEMYPTHIPARIHSNLFHCLLAVIKGSSEDDQANIFIQQLEQLIEKLKTLLPCLLKKIDGKDGKLCTINDDIGRLFGMNPGKYNLNMDALSCVKDKDGHCIHNPAQKNNSDMNKPTQPWMSNHNEEVTNNEAETEDCARINSVDKWPTATKRIWKLKQQKQKLNDAKKIRLSSENDQPIELVMEDVVTTSIKPADKVTINTISPDTINSEEKATKSDPEPVQSETVEENVAALVDQNNKLKTHAQFHSAHFDIRSSPIKLPSALVRKFQFNPEKLAKFEIEVLRPLALDKDIANDTESFDSMPDLFRSNVETPKDNVLKNDLTFDPTKNWVETSNDSSHDSFIKSSLMFEQSLSTPDKNDSLIDPSLMHVNDKTLFEPSPKTKSLIEETLLQIQKPGGLIEHSLIDINDKQDSLFGPSQSLTQAKDHSNGYYEPSSIHVKPKCNSLIGSSALSSLKDKSFELALSHVKDRSSNLFESSLLQNSKTNSLVDSLINNVKDEDSFFSTGLTPTKERSHHLFESSLIDMKDKNNILDPTLLLKDVNSALFETNMTPTKSDIIDQSLVHSDTNSSISLDHATENNTRSATNIEINQSDNLSTNDSSELSNQGQSVLNFLECLNSEPLVLAYPETEIRNNVVDFQLDLFSFSNS